MTKLRGDQNNALTTMLRSVATAGRTAVGRRSALALAPHARLGSSSAVNHWQDAPDALPAPPSASPAGGNGALRAPRASHWEEAGSWSAEDIAAASQENAMFTWGPSDGARSSAIDIARGEGVYLFDRAGKQYLDWTSQAVCTNLGHSPPAAVTEAMSKQMAHCPFVYSGLAMTEIRARTCALMADITPSNISGFLFPSSGAEANEGAIRIAQRFTGRQKIMTRQRSYHGGTTSTLNATGDFRKNFVPEISQSSAFVRMADPNPWSFTWGETEEEATARILSVLDEQMKNEGPDTIAAVLMEHVPGAAGVLLPPKGYVEGVAALCEQYGILLIADEVMTGFGRTGKMFGFQHFDVLPDIVTCAKGITASWQPLSCIGVSSEIQDHFRSTPLGYGATYQAHPVAMACAYEVIKHTLDQKIVEHAASMEPVMVECIQQLVDKHGT